jgi:hypothetical protein
MEMLGLLIGVVGMTGMTVQHDPMNRLDFKAGEVAAMMRTFAGQIVCVISVNGRPGRPGDQDICYVLGTVGGYDILNQGGPGVQLEAVLSILVDGSSRPAPTDMGRAVAIADISARVTVRPDGSIAACTEGPGHVLRQIAGFRPPPPLCELYPPGREPIFVDAAGSTSPRTARMELVYYFRRP